MASVSEPALHNDYVASLTDALQRAWSPDAWAVDAACAYALLPPGKLVRPLLMLDIVDALGGDGTDVIAAAIGVECAHVGSLVHDDIIDGDDTRRGRGSVVATYGIAGAVTAGDALIFRLFAALAEGRGRGLSDARIMDAVGIFAQAGIDLCRGEMAEADLAGDLDCGVDAYIAMVSLKTAALFRAICEVAAVLTGARRRQVSAMAEYGRCLGVAFQIRDDMLPYVADARAAEKPRSSDVRNHRVTLPVLLAYAGASAEDRLELKRLVAATDAPAPDAYEQLSRLLNRTGALNETREVAMSYARRAREQLDVLPRSRIERLAAYPAILTGRER